MIIQEIIQKYVKVKIEKRTQCVPFEHFLWYILKDYEKIDGSIKQWCIYIITVWVRMYIHACLKNDHIVCIASFFKILLLMCPKISFHIKIHIFTFHFDF